MLNKCIFFINTFPPLLLPPIKYGHHDEEVYVLFFPLFQDTLGNGGPDKRSCQNVKKYQSFLHGVLIS